MDEMVGPRLTSKYDWEHLARAFEFSQDPLIQKSENEDFRTIIKKRVREIKIMVKPKRKTLSLEDVFDEETQSLVMHFQDIDNNEFKTDRRKKWKSRDIFRYGVRMIIFLGRAFNPRKRYLSEGGNQKLKDVDKEAIRKEAMAQKSSTGWELQAALTTAPERRSKMMIKKISWILKTTRAFQHLFPSEMEKECAKQVTYAKYDDKRVLACQGRKPEYFYYVLSGKLNFSKEYKLSTGNFVRVLNSLTKGMTSDPEEIENNWTRESYLVVKGHAEVLILESDVFLALQHTSENPPLSFIRSIDLFNDFPVDELFENKEAYDFKYHGVNRIVEKDVNKSNWIYIIKSGHVKVVRKQNIFTEFDPNENVLHQRKPEGHAEAMLGIAFRQKRMKTYLSSSQFKLPKISGCYSGLITRGNDNFEQTFNQSAGSHRSYHSSAGNESDSGDETRSDDSGEEADAEGTLNNDDDDDDKRDVAGTDDVATDDQEEDHEQDKDEAQPESRKSSAVKPESRSAGPSTRATTRLSVAGPYRKRTRRSTAFQRSIMPPINVPLKQDEIDPVETPMEFNLAREITQMHFNTKSKETSSIYRRGYLQLDVLKEGDVYGVSNLRKADDLDTPGVSLISDGAEIIKLSKRHFLKYARNNTLLKVETMEREYLDDDDAVAHLHSRESWNKYKKGLMNRVVMRIMKKDSPKHKKLHRQNEDRLNTPDLIRTVMRRPRKNGRLTESV